MCIRDRNYNGDTVREVFPYYEEGPSLGYGYGWTRFINNMMLVMICLGCLVVVAVSPSFSDEYSRGMDALILTSRLGCTKCPRAKACLLYTSNKMEIHLLLIDVMMPVLDGVDVYKRQGLCFGGRGRWVPELEGS